MRVRGLEPPRQKTHAPKACASAIPPHPRALPRGERRDLNPRPLGPQPSALPTELRSPRFSTPAIRCRSQGAPGRIRTCGPRIRSPLLYPAELQAHIPHGRHGPRGRSRSGRRDSNPRQPAWKAGALPTELHPPARPEAPPVSWSGREDSNLRPPAPKAGALPGCATSRSSAPLWLRPREYSV